MRPELDAALVRDFPSLYRDRHGDMKRTCMVWGFDVGDGWHGIVRELSAAITHATTRHVFGGQAKSGEGYECGFEVVADQVKEKYGRLRFYWHGEAKPGVTPGMVDQEYATEVDGYVDGLVAMAEAMSRVTCELCGSPGKLNSGGWLSVRCGPCRKAEDDPPLRARLGAWASGLKWRVRARLGLEG